MNDAISLTTNVIHLNVWGALHKNASHCGHGHANFREFQVPQNLKDIGYMQMIYVQ